MAAPSQMAVAGLILGAAFLVGGVAGCLAAGWMDGEGAQALSGYLTSYFRYAAEETPAPGFWNAVWEQFRFPLAAFVLGFTAIGVVGLLGGVSVTGFAMAVFMSNAGGAWDNAKKYIERGNHGGKGSDQHKAAVVGDTVGDPFKDTSGPSLNILIKLCSTVSIVFSGLILAFHLL